LRGSAGVSQTERILLFLWLPILLLVAWEAAARNLWIDPLFFPPPTSVLAKGVALTTSGELPRQVLATVRRATVSFFAAALAGLVCGIAMALFPRVRRSLEPLVSALYSTPKVSFLPMLFLVFGIGEAARLVLVAMSAFIVITLYSFDAVRDSNPAFVEMARDYGATGLQLVHRVYVPAAMPQIFTGLRLAAGRALLMTITTELVSGRDGIGAMIWMAGQTLATETLYAGVIVSGILGWMTHRVLRKIESASLPWKRAHAE